MNYEIVSGVFKKDPIIHGLLDIYGIPESGHQADVFNALVRSIVGQQLSVKAAGTIYGRFMELFDEDPVPESLMKVPHELLRKAGLSNQKANYVKNVATFFHDHQLSDLEWESMSDQQVIDLLTQIKGVGVWTVQMFLMFTLNRLDVFPVGDLGIKNGMKDIYGLNSEDNKLIDELISIAEKWRPYRTIGSKLIWLSKDS